jgi:transposase
MGKYSQKLMQHSGIVAGMCDEIKMVEIIDNLIKMPKRKVTVGQAIKSMILNALGFSGRALYLHHRFYKNRPVDILIGEGLTPEDLNDDCLGSALDAIGEAQSRKGFFIIATNEMDSEKISSGQLLSVYKKQGTSVERGFRFLKDPIFFAESLYLKLPKRIMALIMVMGLSLLIYSLA